MRDRGRERERDKDGDGNRDGDGDGRVLAMFFVSLCFKIVSSICHELDCEIQSLMTKIEEQNDPGKAGICMQCLWKRGKGFKHKDSH